MAAQFLQATNKKTGLKALPRDISSPLSLFVELAKRNSSTGETMEDWDFALLNATGNVIELNYDWRKVQVTVEAGSLFR